MGGVGVGVRVSVGERTAPSVLPREIATLRTLSPAARRSRIAASTSRHQGTGVSPRALLSTVYIRVESFFQQVRRSRRRPPLLRSVART